MFKEYIFKPGIDPEKDIVLITGGAQGLGLELVNKFSSKNFKVIVVDIKKCNFPDRKNVWEFQCDISERSNVELLKLKISKLQMGPVTVLINNAAISSTMPLKDKNFDSLLIQNIVKVNFQSNFHLIQVFLPDMVISKRGFIVNICSVLGIVSPARLAVYCASKAALISFHKLLEQETLKNELFNHIRMLIVLPGQINTDMFSHVKTPNNVLAPKLDPRVLANKIFKSMIHQNKVLCAPYYVQITPLLKMLDWPFVFLARYVSGMDRVLD